jgi:hypothetical protein
MPVLLATMPAPDALADAAAAGWRVAAIATEDDLVDAWTEVVERGARRVARPRHVARQRAAAAPAVNCLTLTLWLALLATLPPLARVIHTGPWMPGERPRGGAARGGVRAASPSCRRSGCPRRRSWALSVTGGFFSSVALWGFIPTGAVIAAMPEVVRTASDEIASGSRHRRDAGDVVRDRRLDRPPHDRARPHRHDGADALLAAIALVIVWLIPSIARASRCRRVRPPRDRRAH